MNASVAELQRRLELLEVENQSLRNENQSLRAQSEKALEESRNQNDFLAQIIRDASQPMAIGYADGRLGIVNRAFEQLTGYTAEEVQAIGWLALTPPEWHQMELEKLAEQDRTGLPIRYEKEYLRKDGSRVPIELLVHRVAGASGNVEYYYSFVTDITHRKQVERSLRESEERIRLATEATGVGIWEWNVLTSKIRWDAQMFHIYGIAPTADGIIPYATWSAAVLSEDLPQQERELWETVRRVGHGSREFRIRRPGDNDCRFIQAVETVRVNAQGHAEWVVGTNVDITDRKTAERALQEGQNQNEFLAKLVRDASQPLAIAYPYPHGGVGLVNRAFEQLTGYTAEELRSIGRAPLTPPEHRELENKKLAELRHPGQSVRYKKEYIRKDGTRVPVELLVHLVAATESEPECYYTFVTDITQRIEAEEALRQREAELRSITANIPDIVARFDRQFRNVFVNAAATAATGIKPEDFRGKTHREMGFPADLCDKWDAALGAAFESGQPQSASFTFNTPAGQRRYDLRVIPEVGETGEIHHVVGLTRDVTDAARAAEELTRAKEAAENASAAKDQFLAVLSHELRTPLAPVRMALSLWEQQARSSAHAFPLNFREDLAMIRRNVDLECRLIDDMLDLNRITRGKLDLQFASVDVHEEVRHAIKTVEAEASARQIELTFAADATHPKVKGDAARLQQALWNVLKNAVKFTPPGGSVVVRTYNDAGHHLCVEIRDTGVGIEAEAMKRIFNAFEQGDLSVTRQFGGLGLGLAISRALVEMHGGKLICHSDGKGRGSIFTLQLRLVPPQHQASENHHAPALAVGLSAQRRDQLLSILLVEDHKDTAHVMQRLLRSFGYDVHTAGTVAEGLASARSRAFDLIISDIGLPDGNGYDLMRQILAHRPTRGIALTGYGMEEDVQKGLDAGFAAHLTKPINIEQLELTIRRVMKEHIIPR